MRAELSTLIELSVAEARIEVGTDPGVAAAGTSRGTAVLLRRKSGRRARGRGANGRDNRWTEEQMAFVRETLGYLTLEEIGAWCGGRSRNAIKLLFTRKGWPAPSKQPHELTAHQVAELMGMCGKLVIRLIELGILPGRVLPGGRNIRVVRRIVFERWLINPANWIYFKLRRIRDRRCRRLVQLAQARWPDKWLTTGQAARLVGLKESNAINARIHRGEFPSARRWQNWWLLKSDVERLKIVPGNGSPGRTRGGWTPRGDAFLLRARASGFGWREIGRLMGPRYSEKRARYRYVQLQREAGNDCLPPSQHKEGRGG